MTELEVLQNIALYLGITNALLIILIIGMFICYLIKEIKKH